MEIYSFELNLFNKRLKDFIKEYGVGIGYDFSFIRIVLFEDRKSLGFYQEQFGKHVVGVNKILAEKDFKLAQDIVKHEIGHYICNVRFEDACQSHGKNFNNVCKEIGANALAKEDIKDMEIRLGADDHDKIVARVKKMLNTDGRTAEEAEAFTLKANAILMKYNLSHIEESDVIYFKRLLRVGQINAKNRAIMAILRTFGVYPVYSQVNSRNYIIEVSGTKANVEIADYVCQFLNTELEKLYKQARKENHLSGLRAKNAFFNGVSSGYQSKFDKQKAEIVKSNGTNEIVLMNQKIEELAKEHVYEKLTKGRGSKEEGHGTASTVGYRKGQKLSINQGITSGDSSKPKLLE